MAKLTPYIQADDARSQSDFYINAVGGEVKFVLTFDEIPGSPEDMHGKVMHMHIAIAGGNDLFLSDVIGAPSEDRMISLSLTYDSEDEARDVFARLSDGGHVQHPFGFQPWGAYYGEIIDRFGVFWMVVKQ